MPVCAWNRSEGLCKQLVTAGVSYWGSPETRLWGQVISGNKDEGGGEENREGSETRKGVLMSRPCV